MCVCVPECVSVCVCVAQHICLGCSTHFRIKGRQCGALAACQKCAQIVQVHTHTHAHTHIGNRTHTHAERLALYIHLCAL